MINADKKRLNADGKLIYGQLTYRIRGAIFNVYNTLCSGHKEQVYQKALAKELTEMNIPYKREVPLAVNYKGLRVGNYRPDFIVDNRVILELKAVRFMPKSYAQQLVHYLKTTNFKVGLLINFGAPRLEIKRLVWTHNPRSSALHPRKSKTKVLFITAFFLSLLLIIANITKVYAQGFSLSLSPPLLEVTMRPGKKITYAYQVKNNSSSPITLIARIAPFEPVGERGQIKIVKSQKSKVTQHYVECRVTLNRTCSGSWVKSWGNFFSLLNADIALDQPFIIPPDQSQQLVLKISLPQNAPEGDYYQTLILKQIAPNIDHKNTASQTLGIIGSNILLTISKSGRPPKKAEVVEFTPRNAILGRFFDSFSKPRLGLRIKNTGRAFFKPIGEITITPGGQKINLRPDNILTGTIRQIQCEDGPCQIKPDKIIGHYQAQLKFTAGEGGPAYKAAVDFWVLPIKLIIGLIVAISLLFVILKGKLSSF